LVNPGAQHLFCGDAAGVLKKDIDNFRVGREGSDVRANGLDRVNCLNEKRSRPRKEVKCNTGSYTGKVLDMGRGWAFFIEGRKTQEGSDSLEVRRG